MALRQAATPALIAESIRRRHVGVVSTTAQGMHWRRYEHLRARYDEAVVRSLKLLKIWFRAPPDHRFASSR